MDIVLEKNNSFSPNTFGVVMIDDRRSKILGGCDTIKITLYYVRGEKAFRILREKPEDREFGTLEIEIEIDGFFGGPGVSIRDDKGELLQLARIGSAASLHVHLPEGGVSTRDGVGDWTKAFEISATGKVDYVP